MAQFEHGQYEVEIVDQGFGESEKKGTPFFFIAFQPDGRYERDIRWYLKTDQNVDIFLRDLQKLGMTVSKFSDLDVHNGGGADLRGSVVTVECYHEPGESGNLLERWQLPYEARERKPLDAKGAKRLDALFGKQLKQTAPAKAPQNKPKPAAKPVGELTPDEAAAEAAKGNSDVPF